MMSRFRAMPRLKAVVDRWQNHLRNWRSFVLAFLVVVFAFGAIVAAVSWSIKATHNRQIEALIHNHNIVVQPNAAPELLFARAYFLLTHDQMGGAQPFLAALDAGNDRRLRADLHYDMANALLKLAFTAIERGDFDQAGPYVVLSREDYHEALRLDPDDWDARYNFDVASRLIREYPQFIPHDDPRRRDPTNLWTHLPIKPEGEP
jgi:mxaK protein